MAHTPQSAKSGRGVATSYQASFTGSHGHWESNTSRLGCDPYPAFFGSNKVKLAAESLAARGHFSVGAGSPHCGLTPSAGTWAPRHLLGRGGAA